jgi:RNA polymerase sigma-70 factor (ECF subfamily)
MSVPPNADRLLIEGIRKGDADAWQKLIDRYEGRVQAYIRQRCGERPADDLVQETFLGFHRALPNYDSETPIENFLFSIAAHKVVDWLRRESGRANISLDVESSGPGVPAAPGRFVSSALRGQEQRQLDADWLREELARLIRQWQAEENFERLMCIELLFACGWSNKAAAAALGISEQQVANHKHAVVSKLKGRRSAPAEGGTSRGD